MNYSFLGIGTNLGKKNQNITSSLGFIQSFAAIISASNIIKTPALLPQGSPTSWDIPYFNLVLYIKTDLSVFQLLTQIKNVEKQMGRDLYAKHWSPRIIDIDILIFNSLILSNLEITIPHKYIASRRFVLEPMCEIAPNFIHPVLNKSFKDLLAEVDSQV